MADRPSRLHSDAVIPAYVIQVQVTQLAMLFLCVCISTIGEFHSDFLGIYLYIHLFYQERYQVICIKNLKFASWCRPGKLGLWMKGFIDSHTSLSPVIPRPQCQTAHRQVEPLTKAGRQSLSWAR